MPPPMMAMCGVDEGVDIVGGLKFCYYHQEEHRGRSEV